MKLGVLSAADLQSDQSREPMSYRPPAVLAAVMVLFFSGPAASQDGPPEGLAPTIAGSAVLTRGPLQVDTIPILCHDANRPELGFITDVGDIDWAPEIELSLWPTPGTSDHLSIRFDDGEDTYDRTFPLGTPTTGIFSASVNIVSWDPGPGVDLYLGANCSRRLKRGGEEP
jgi:hypothetical protein